MSNGWQITSAAVTSCGRPWWHWLLTLTHAGVLRKLSVHGTAFTQLSVRNVIGGLSRCKMLPLPWLPLGGGSARIVIECIRRVMLGVARRLRVLALPYCPVWLIGDPIALYVRWYYQWVATGVVLLVRLYFLLYFGWYLMLVLLAFSYFSSFWSLTPFIEA